MACPCGGCIVGLSRTIRRLRPQLAEAEELGKPAAGRAVFLAVEISRAEDALIDCLALRESEPLLSKRPVRDALFGALWTPAAETA